MCGDVTSCSAGQTVLGGPSNHQCDEAEDDWWKRCLQVQANDEEESNSPSSIAMGTERMGVGSAAWAGPVMSAHRGGALRGGARV